MARNLAYRLQIFGSIASIVGVAAAGVTFWFALSANSKDLSVRVLSDNVLLDQPLKDNLRLVFNGVPIENVVTYVVEIKNTGRQPIKPGDFDGSFDLVVTGVTEIISVDQSNHVPEQLSFVVASGDHTVSLKPLLLNPGDQGTLVIKATLPAGSDPALEIENARLSGIKKVVIEPTSHQERASHEVCCTLLFVVVAFLSATLALAVVVLRRIGRKLPEDPSSLLEDEDGNPLFSPGHG